MMVRAPRLVAAFVFFFALSAFGFNETITLAPSRVQPGQAVTVSISGLSKTGGVHVDATGVSGTIITIDATSVGGICGPACLYSTSTTFNAPAQPGTYDVQYWLTFDGQRTFGASATLVVANGCDFGHALVADKTSVRVGDSVSLSWCDPATHGIDAGYYVNFYRIYSSQSADGPFSANTEVQGETNTHAQVTPAAGTTYYYVESHGCQGVVTMCAGAGAMDTTMLSNIVAVNAAAAGKCLPDATTLCVGGGRFQITARWQTADGHNGDGQAVSLTDRSGYFWFFDKNNVEVTAKILDACSMTPPAFWFFASGMTDVQVDLTVTDTQTHLTQRYSSPLGKPFATILDTNAFSCH